MADVGARAGLRDWLSLVRFSHTVFALPFACTALLVASRGAPTLRVCVLIVLAMVAARTAAMAYNRWVDRDVDAQNPRTRAREIPRGVIRPRAALLLAVAASAAFVSVAWLLGPACFWASWPVLAVLLGYSHGKRFTSLVHLWLGLSLGLAPVAAWLAVRGTIDAGLWIAALLGAGVACWVAGFDVVYACQDDEFDRRSGLFSWPARLGRRRALALARGLHVVACAAFAAFGVVAGLGWAWSAGVAVAAILLVWQHRIVRPDDLGRVNTAFFTANGSVSIALFAAALVDVAWRGALA